MAVRLTGFIRSALAAASGVTNLCAATNIYANEIPEGSGLPRVVITEPRGDNDHLFGGKELGRGTIVVTVYAEDGGLAWDIGKACHAVLNPLTGTFDSNQNLLALVRVSDTIKIQSQRPKSGKPVTQIPISYLAFVEET